MKIIFIDGPDVSGKTTLIKNSLKKYKNLKELNFNKGLTGLLRINTQTHFEILKVLLPNLDPKFTYIVDRCYFSNIVYDKVLRNEDASPSYEFRHWCLKNLKILEIVLDRKYVDYDFSDNLISMNKNTFNKVIDEYRNLNAKHNYNILTPEKYNLKKVQTLIKQFLT